jgi:hypothetical protein
LLKEFKLDKRLSSLRRNTDLDPESRINRQRLKNEQMRLGLEKPQQYRIREEKEDHKTTILFIWNNPKKVKIENLVTLGEDGELIPIEEENDFEIPVGCLEEGYYGHTPHATNFNTYMKEAESPSEESLRKSYGVYKRIQFKYHALDEEDEYNSEWENNLLDFKYFKEREMGYFDMTLENYQDNYFNSIYSGAHALPQTDNKEESISTFVKHFLFWARNNKEKYKDTNIPIPEEFDPYRITREK